MVDAMGAGMDSVLGLGGGRLEDVPLATMLEPRLLSVRERGERFWVRVRRRIADGGAGWRLMGRKRIHHFLNVLRAWGVRHWPSLIREM